VEADLKGMTETTIGTVRTLLKGAIAETDDPEVHFKLRTALQLLAVIDRQQEVASEALEHAEIEADVRENLRELGYLG
jgi:hypothetical protein